MTDSELTIQNKIVPQNSWCATVKVTNSEIIKAVENHELTCFSLGSVSREAKTRDSWFIDKRISYHDLKSIEDVIPLFISLVDMGANGFPFEILDYETYINKSKMKEEIEMTEENNTNEARFSFKEWLGIEKHFKEQVVEKAEEDETTEENEPTTAEQNIQALFDKVDALDEKLDSILEMIKPTEEIDKEETDETEEATEEENDDESAEETDIDKSEETNETENDESAEEETEPEPEAEAEAEEETADETDINKRQTQKTADIPQTNETQSNFYKNTNRDHFGRKIRN